MKFRIFIYETVLHVAVENQFPEIVKLLLNYEDININLMKKYSILITNYLMKFFKINL